MYSYYGVLTDCNYIIVVFIICMQVYGYQYLLSMNSLEAAGLLKVQEGGRAFSAIKQNLRLCNQEVDEKNPTDISYCYSGYAPLSVRLVEHIIKHKSWTGMEEVIVLLEKNAVL